MTTSLRIATFNLENLDDQPGDDPTLAERIAVMRPQMERLRADVLCLQEIHGQETTGQPRDVIALRTLLQGTAYHGFDLAHTLTSNNEAYDQRNLVVASRFPVIDRRQLKHDLVPRPQYRPVTANPPDTTANEISWERPIFYVALDVGAGRILHVINLHLKSKLPSNIEGQKIDRFTWRSASGWAEGSFLASMRRVGQALEVRVLIDQLFDGDPNALIAVCGDFNSTDESVPVQAISGRVEETGNPALGARVMVPCENTIPESARYSLIHHGRGEMLDHVLVSRSLLGFYRGAEVHNELLPDESGAFRTDSKFPESDHAPLVAEFVLP